jgi:holo-[acyl-carrier protein] synthase
MILGTGIDIVSIRRVEDLLKKMKGKFVSRILSRQEMDLMEKECLNDLQLVCFIAKRFAAKEAVSKAIGCGIGSTISWSSIVIIKDKLGRPMIEKNRDIADAVRKCCHVASFKFHISISDEKDYAVAMAILEKNETKNQGFIE